ncbi:hypothetical protein [Clostridium tagluense]|uniref:Uncharacterized protein n=1 Tax=Clostridium tagluense TaxID=360422 RepID=A0A401USW5_9CLOT|nr:hypothetical protein [Clostridium tagluense]GCD12645.1 hypothetical protein Ctaglu_42680 [Clostridium tagluense]
MLNKKDIQLLQASILCALTDINLDYRLEDKFIELDEKLGKMKKLLV